jgi:hypothetical protein
VHFRTAIHFIIRVVIALCLAGAVIATSGAQPDPTDNSLQTYAVQMLQGSPQFVAGAGVYLGNGLAITASHVAGPNHPAVRIDGIDVPAKMIKRGSFDTIDLALFSVDQEKLTDSLRSLHMPLCAGPPQVGAPIILAAPQGGTRSTILSPLVLSPTDRTKWPTLISDVETSGKSGSGVFDAEKRCLHGILSALVSGTKITDPIERIKVGTYFVPANIIQSFAPAGTRW